MILCHEHRFIFLKTTKTAGTSIEIALSRVCGPKDVITPFGPRDERTREELGGTPPQNYLAPLSAYGVGDLIGFPFGKRKKRFYNHMPAREARTFIPREIWDSYYKFCFARNPWDRALSYYYWTHKSEPRPSLSEFIRSGALRTLMETGYHLYTEDGKLAVDHVCRYENLEQELNAIRERLGIRQELSIPRAKSQFRQDRRPYQEVLSESERRSIEEEFAPEIELLDYRF